MTEQSQSLSNNSYNCIIKLNIGSNQVILFCWTRVFFAELKTRKICSRIFDFVRQVTTLRGWGWCFFTDWYFKNTFIPSEFRCLPATLWISAVFGVVRALIKPPPQEDQIRAFRSEGSQRNVAAQIQRWRRSSFLRVMGEKYLASLYFFGLKKMWIFDFWRFKNSLVLEKTFYSWS